MVGGRNSWAISMSIERVVSLVAFKGIISFVLTLVFIFNFIFCFELTQKNEVVVESDKLFIIEVRDIIFFIKQQAIG